MSEEKEAMASTSSSSWPVQKLEVERVDDVLSLVAGNIYTIDKPVLLGPKAVVRVKGAGELKRAVLRCTPTFYANSLEWKPYMRGAMLVNFGAGEEKWVVSSRRAESRAGLRTVLKLPNHLGATSIASESQALFSIPTRRRRATRLATSLMTRGLGGGRRGRRSLGSTCKGRGARARVRARRREPCPS